MQRGIFIAFGKTTPIDVSVFDTRMAPAREQYGLWRDSIGVIFDVKDGGCDQRDRYTARLESALIDATMISRVRSGHQQFTRDSNRSYRDGLDSVMFQVFVNGDVRRADEASAMASGHSIVGFDLTRSVDNINSEFDLVSIIFSRDELIERNVDPEAIHLKVLGQEGGLPALTAQMIVDLQVQLPLMDKGEAALACQSAIDLIAECYRGEARRERSRSAHRNALLLRARQEIRRRLEAGLSVDTGTLLEILPCSRSTLYRAFEPIGGVAGFVRSERLRKALGRIARMAGGPEQTQLGDIGAECGFTSDAHFSRAFKTEFGFSPSTARDIFQQKRREAGFSDDFPTDRRYELWLQSISQ